MPQHCKTCEHPERASIDAALLSGASSYDVARRFKGLNPRAIQRHSTRHLAEPRARALEAVAEATYALAALAERRRADVAIETTQHVREAAARLVADVLKTLRDAQASGDARLALAAVREARGCLETLDGMLGTSRSWGVAAWSSERVEIDTSTIEELLSDADRAEMIADAAIDATLRALDRDVPPAQR